MRNVYPSARGQRRYGWWRAYHGLPQHSKWRSVSREANVPVSVAFHVAACLLDLASRSTPRGSIANFKPFDCAGIVDVPVADVERVVDVLRKIQWIDNHMLADWDERQPQREDDTAAARQAKHRMSRNVTPMSRNVTPPMRDAALPNVTSANVTINSPPDKKERYSSSVLGAAREKQNPPARSLAGASEPASEPAAKRPSDVSRQELDEMLERKRTGVPHAPKH